MGKRRKDYDEVEAVVRIPKGTKLDASKQTEGALRGLARNADKKLVGHAEIFIKDPKESEKPRKEKRSAENASFEQVIYTPASTSQRRSDDMESYSYDDETESPDISKLVPGLLVAGAAVAVGVAGVKVAKHLKKKRAARTGSQPEWNPTEAVGSAPAGWYEEGVGGSRLRYWDGRVWTNEFAHRQRNAPTIAADWYPDPSNPAQLRYWDGSAWTHHVHSPHQVTTIPADWYPDPSNPAQLRYWDGSAWTGHVHGHRGTSMAHRPASTPASVEALGASHQESVIVMTAAEWQTHVRAWVVAGAIEQELWWRLSHAWIDEADQATLDAQRKMAELTPDEGARRIGQLLASNPSLRAELSIAGFLRAFGAEAVLADGVERAERKPLPPS